MPVQSSNGLRRSRRQATPEYKSVENYATYQKESPRKGPSQQSLFATDGLPTIRESIEGTIKEAPVVNRSDAPSGTEHDESIDELYGSGEHSSELCSVLDDYTIDDSDNLCKKSTSHEMGQGGSTHPMENEHTVNAQSVVTSDSESSETQQAQTHGMTTTPDTVPANSKVAPVQASKSSKLCPKTTSSKQGESVPDQTTLAHEPAGTQQAQAHGMTTTPDTVPANSKVAPVQASKSPKLCPTTASKQVIKTESGREFEYWAVPYSTTDGSPGITFSEKQFSMTRGDFASILSTFWPGKEWTIYDPIVDEEDNGFPVCFIDKTLTTDTFVDANGVKPGDVIFVVTKEGAILTVGSRFSQINATLSLSREDGAWVVLCRYVGGDEIPPNALNQAPLRGSSSVCDSEVDDDDDDVIVVDQLRGPHPSPLSKKVLERYKLLRYCLEPTTTSIEDSDDDDDDTVVKEVVLRVGGTIQFLDSISKISKGLFGTYTIYDFRPNEIVIEAMENSHATVTVDPDAFREGMMFRYKPPQLHIAPLETQAPPTRSSRQRESQDQSPAKSSLDETPFVSVCKRSDGELSATGRGKAPARRKCPIH